MNRQQRRQHAKIAYVSLDQIENDFSKFEDQHWAILWRIKQNLAQTGHPMHHKTADGTIVDLDVTLEHWINQLKPLPSVPVNRKHYGFDLYADKKGK